MCLSNSFMPSAFVKGSIAFSFPSTFSILTSPRSIISLIKWYLHKICLDFWCYLGSFAWAIALLLSHNNGTDSSIEGTTPSSNMNFFIQTASWTTSLAAIYSALVVESATVAYLELFQLTAPPFKVKIYPEMDLLSSLSYAKLASV